MLGFIIGLLKVICVLGVLITVHEAGHCIVAKKFKVKVRQFAIGFGPIIWQKETPETLYQLRLIPLGGFCDMLGESEQVKQKGSYSEASVGKRMAIILAGATVNIVIGLILFFSLAMFKNEYASTTVNYVEPNYAAAEAGIESGDIIKKINGKSIHLKTDVDKILNASQGEELVFLVERNNEEKEIKVSPTKREKNSVGITFGYSEEGYSREVLAVTEGKPAERAGLKPGDTFLKINDQEVTDSDTLSELILYADELIVTILRDGKEMTIDIGPEKISTYYLGVAFKLAENNLKNNLSYSFWNTVDYLSSIAQSLKELFTGKGSIDNMMGPIGISQIIVKSSGIYDFIYLFSIVSLSLGVTNLLPIPALDGGKFVFLVIEAIRRKPVPEKIVGYIESAGFLLLIALSIYIAIKDVIRLF